MASQTEVVGRITEFLDGLDFTSWAWQQDLEPYLKDVQADSWLFVCDEDYRDILKVYLMDELRLKYADVNEAFEDWQLQDKLDDAAREFEEEVIVQEKNFFREIETQFDLSIPGVPLDEVTMVAEWTTGDGVPFDSNIGVIEYRVYRPETDDDKQYGGFKLVSRYTSEAEIKAELKQRLADFVEELTAGTYGTYEEYYGDY